MTSIAVLQCVERGLAGLDEDVARLLPELSGKDIIVAFDETTGQATLKRSQRPVTLRYVERICRMLGAGWPESDGYF